MLELIHTIRTHDLWICCAFRFQRKFLHMNTTITVLASWGVIKGIFLVIHYVLWTTNTETKVMNNDGQLYFRMKKLTNFVLTTNTNWRNCFPSDIWKWLPQLWPTGPVLVRHRCYIGPRWVGGPSTGPCSGSTWPPCSGWPLSTLAYYYPFFRLSLKANTPTTCKRVEFEIVYDSTTVLTLCIDSLFWFCPIKRVFLCSH